MANVLPHSCNPSTPPVRTDRRCRADRPTRRRCSTSSSLPPASSSPRHPTPSLPPTSSLLRRSSTSPWRNAPAMRSLSLIPAPATLPARRRLSRLQGRCSSSSCPPLVNGVAGTECQRRLYRIALSRAALLGWWVFSLHFRISIAIIPALPGGSAYNSATTFFLYKGRRHFS